MFKNVVALLFMQGMNYLIPLMTLPYLTRTLGDYGYGKLSTALTIAQYVVLLVDFGFNLSSTKIISENRTDIKKINDIFWNTLSAKLMIFIVAFPISMIFVCNISKYNEIILVYLFLLPQIIGSVFFPVWLFQGVEKIKMISIVTVMSKLIPLPFLFFFVKAPENINIASFILALPILLSALISIPMIRSIGIKWKSSISIKTVYNVIIYSRHYFIGSVAISVYTLSTPILLSLVSSFSEVGKFAAADKLRVAVISVFLILGQAIYPRANHLMATDMNAYNIFMKRLMIFQLCGCLLCACLFYIFAPSLSVYIFGNAFLNVGDLIRLMAPMIFFIPASVILANCIMLPHGNTKAYAIIPWITASVHMIYAAVLSHAYGAKGASISILITEVVSFSFLLCFCIKKGYIRNILRNV